MTVNTIAAASGTFPCRFTPRVLVSLNGGGGET